jgi:hypothetical protein
MDHNREQALCLLPPQWQSVRTRSGRIGGSATSTAMSDYSLSVIAGQVKGNLRLSPSIPQGVYPLSHRGIPSGIPTPEGTVVAGAILLGFVSLGRLWFRRRLAGTFNLPVGQFPDGTSNARESSLGSKTVSLFSARRSTQCHLLEPSPRRHLAAGTSSRRGYL